MVSNPSKRDLQRTLTDVTLFMWRWICLRRGRCFRNSGISLIWLPLRLRYDKLSSLIWSRLMSWSLKKEVSLFFSSSRDYKSVNYNIDTGRVLIPHECILSVLRCFISPNSSGMPISPSPGLLLKSSTDRWLWFYHSFGDHVLISLFLQSSWLFPTTNSLRYTSHGSSSVY